jgi:transcription elongation factor Elf1
MRWSALIGSKIMLKTIINFFNKFNNKALIRSEWEMRNATNPWRTDFVCPLCDTIVENTQYLWKKVNRKPTDDTTFNFQCNVCNHKFKVEVGVVVMFKSYKDQYQSTQEKSGFRLIDGGKSA